MVHEDNAVPVSGPVQKSSSQSRKRDRKAAAHTFGSIISGLPVPSIPKESSTMMGPPAVPVSPRGVMSHDSLMRDLSSPPPKIPRLGMYDTYQPWVLQTYGDSAKTKTITKNKYQRILQILRGDYIDNETSKFKLWVKGRGFRIGPPPGYFQNYDGSPAGGEGVGGAPPLRSTQTGVDYNPDKDPRPDIFVQTGTVKVRFGHSYL